uniref:Uncharacterized protein n=1 Tax=viral metagenome TaxID=1070528 RepID=A0A6M3KIZ2_9ZZZZ
MGVLTAATMITAMRLELQDPADGSTIWSDAELTRGITKSVSLMSRLIPKRVIVETTLTREVTGEALTIASSTGTLAYKPVKVGSVSITGETLDTDYTINYLTGVVTEKGALLIDGAYTVSYKLDPKMLDISTLLSDYIKIERVEYPAGDSPATHITPNDIFGSLVIFKDDVTLMTNKHIRIVYLTFWTAPGASAGDYPTSLDNAVVIGAVGQSLIFKAELYVQEAITNIAASKTLLDAISAVTAPTAPTITGYLTSAETALNAAIARFAAAVLEVDKMDAPLANAATAMGKVAAEIALGNGYLDSGSALITTINDADRVADTYAGYAQAEAALGQGYGIESQQDISLAIAWEARAAREMGIGNSYVNEAVQRLAEASRLVDKYQMDVGKYTQDNAYYQAQLAKSREYQTTAAQYLEIAGRYLSSGQAKINEMFVMLGVKPEFQFYKGSSEQFV